MPGRVSAVKVAVGQRVAKGEELLVVEAMKMENALRAPRTASCAPSTRAWARWWLPGGRSWRSASPGAGVSAACRRASRSSRSAPATGCRTRAPRSASTTGSPSAIGSSPRAFRSSRWGPSSRRSGCRRWRAPTRCCGACASRAGVRLPVLVPNRQGFERARGGRRARDRRLHRGERELQPPQHERVDRRDLRALRRRSCRRRASEGLRVRGYVSTAFGCPYEGPVGPGARGRSSRAAWSRRAVTRCRSGIPSVSRCRRR